MKSITIRMTMRIENVKLKMIVDSMHFVILDSVLTDEGHSESSPTVVGVNVIKRPTDSVTATQGDVPAVTTRRRGGETDVSRNLDFLGQ